MDRKSFSFKKKIKESDFERGGGFFSRIKREQRLAKGGDEREEKRSLKLATQLSKEKGESLQVFGWQLHTGERKGWSFHLSFFFVGRG